MRALSAADILAVWAIGRRQHSPERAFTMLAAAWPESRREDLATLSIGDRDARLLAMRAQVFGTQLKSHAACPHCARETELSLNVSEILASPTPDARELAVVVGEFAVRFRLPNSLDVAEAAAARDVNAVRAALLARCILDAEKSDQKISVEQLPDAVIETVAARMSEVDPHADVTFEITCPNCGHCWSTLFDIVSFFWAEIEARAIRLLHEVHTLASAYGWREADILALSPLHRQCYLEMVGA